MYKYTDGKVLHTNLENEQTNKYSQLIWKYAEKQIEKNLFSISNCCYNEKSLYLPEASHRLGKLLKRYNTTFETINKLAISKGIDIVYYPGYNSMPISIYIENYDDNQVKALVDKAHHDILLDINLDEHERNSIKRASIFFECEDNYYTLLKNNSVEDLKFKYVLLARAITNDVNYDALVNAAYRLGMREIAGNTINGRYHKYLDVIKNHRFVTYQRICNCIEINHKLNQIDKYENVEYQEVRDFQISSNQSLQKKATN